MSRFFTHRGWGLIALAMTLCAVFLAASIAQAADVTLAWNASITPGVTGYRIHQGTSTGTYTTIKDVGSGLTTIITGLTPGQRYFFAASAYDGFGQQSGFSNEVNYLVPLPPPPVAPTSLRVTPVP